MTNYRSIEKDCSTAASAERDNATTRRGVRIADSHAMKRSITK